MQQFRSRIAIVRKNLKHEQEINIITNPQDQNKNTTLRQQRQPHDGTSLKMTRFNSIDDYQAPMTSFTLRPNSKWKLVRENLHKIRSWRQIQRIDDPFQDWYIFFQMKRELKRAEKQIKNIEYLSNFKPIRYFPLAIDETHFEIYDTSQVKPTDAIFYSSSSGEPIILQYMLYYFAKESFVPYNGIFRPFLGDISSVIKANRNRSKRTQVLQNLALLGSIAVYILIGLMFLVLLINILNITSKLSVLTNSQREEFYSNF
ncbi:unnamed protein product [Didymodactylos carnosus]|uniref:Uncharacterized protein n=1 Tax=Didymodactylos carnosus TaxID=1234261 RepID=A0A813YP32_9BILA|nr:unnamed protein product [Didymodactylos carnosus]CAF1114449.1 unnamed protein product [Didymodactylos carnosus]CAF3672092.1 unnamed protein product [Didymodactylos carnosus]CAF3883868.1 unnamed protein product [Didymodactylos carnosus]